MLCHLSINYQSPTFPIAITTNLVMSYPSLAGEVFPDDRKTLTTTSYLCPTFSIPPTNASNDLLVRSAETSSPFYSHCTTITPVVPLPPLTTSAAISFLLFLSRVRQLSSLHLQPERLLPVSSASDSPGKEDRS